MATTDAAPGADAVQQLRDALAAVEGGAALQPLFESATEWVALAAGEVLTRAGERDAGLYLLISGALDVVRAPAGGDAAAAEVRGTVRAPEIVGEMQLLTGGVRTATLRAAEPTLLARVPAEVFEQASRNAPELLRTLATRVFTGQCAAPFIRPPSSASICPSGEDILPALSRGLQIWRPQPGSFLSFALRGSFSGGQSLLQSGTPGTVSPRHRADKSGFQ